MMNGEPAVMRVDDRGGLAVLLRRAAAGGALTAMCPRIIRGIEGRRDLAAVVIHALGQPAQAFVHHAVDPVHLGLSLDLPPPRRELQSLQHPPYGPSGRRYRPRVRASAGRVLIPRVRQRSVPHAPTLGPLTRELVRGTHPAVRRLPDARPATSSHRSPHSRRRQPVAGAWSRRRRRWRACPAHAGRIRR